MEDKRLVEMGTTRMTKRRSTAQLDEWMDMLDAEEEEDNRLPRGPQTTARPPL